MRSGPKTALAVGAMLLAAAVPANAANTPEANDHGLEDVAATCDGGATAVVATAGAAFWADGSKYVITSFTTTFTPDGGGEPQVFTKVNGKRNGSDTEITCTGTESVPGGTVRFDVIGDLIR
jgi:hypothetical protein